MAELDWTFFWQKMTFKSEKKNQKAVNRDAIIHLNSENTIGSTRFKAGLGRIPRSAYVNPHFDFSKFCLPHQDYQFRIPHIYMLIPHYGFAIRMFDYLFRFPHLHSAHIDANSVFRVFTRRRSAFFAELTNVWDAHWNSVILGRIQNIFYHD